MSTYLPVSCYLRCVWENKWSFFSFFKLFTSRELVARFLPRWLIIVFGAKGSWCTEDSSTLHSSTTGSSSPHVSSLRFLTCLLVNFLSLPPHPLFLLFMKFVLFFPWGVLLSSKIPIYHWSPKNSLERFITKKWKKISFTFRLLFVDILHNRLND